MNTRYAIWTSASFIFSSVLGQPVTPRVSLIPLYPEQGSFPEAIRNETVFLTQGGNFVVSYVPVDPLAASNGRGRTECTIVFPHQISGEITSSVQVQADGGYLYSYQVQSSATSKYGIQGFAIPLRSRQANGEIYQVASAEQWARVENAKAAELLWRSSTGLAPGATGQFSVRSSLWPGLSFASLATNRTLGCGAVTLPENVVHHIRKLEEMGYGGIQVPVISGRYAKRTHVAAIAYDFFQNIEIAIALGALQKASPYVQEIQTHLRDFLDLARSRGDIPLEDVFDKLRFRISTLPASSLEVAIDGALKVSLALQ